MQPKFPFPIGCLSRLLKAWWSEEAVLAVRNRRRARSQAYRFEAHRLAYVEASRRASSDISRAKCEAWQATCNNLCSRSNSCAVFNLLNRVADKKGSSRDLKFSNSQSSKDTADIYTSYFRSHFSQQTLRLSRSAERSFMNNLRSDQCSDSSLNNIFYSPFTTKELTTAISKLSTSTASGPGLIAYPLVADLPYSDQQHLLSIFNWSWYSLTFPHARNLPPLSPFTNSTLQPSIPISRTYCIFKLFESLVLNRLCYYLESKNLISSTQAGFRPSRSTIDKVLLLIQSIWDGFQKKKTSRPNCFGYHWFL